MADLISRRDLFSKKILRMIFDPLPPENSLSPEAHREESILSYFQSPLHSYPLLQEMPLDMLIAEARAQGITIEGRSKNEIARDLFLKIESLHH